MHVSLLHCLDFCKGIILKRSFLMKKIDNFLKKGYELSIRNGHIKKNMSFANIGGLSVTATRQNLVAATLGYNWTLAFGLISKSEIKLQMKGIRSKWVGIIKTLAKTVTAYKEGAFFHFIDWSWSLFTWRRHNNSLRSLSGEKFLMHAL